MTGERSRERGTPVAPRARTTRQPTRQEIEQRRQRLLVGAVMGGIALALALIAVPYIQANLIAPAAQLARVGDQRITRGDYEAFASLQRVLGTEVEPLPSIFEAYRTRTEEFREALRRQAEESAEAEGPAASEPTAAALDAMIENAVLVGGAQEAGVDLSEAAVDRKVREYLYPAGAPGAAPTGVATPGTAATPVAAARPTAQPTAPPGAPTTPPVIPTAGPPSPSDFDGFFATLREGLGVSREEYERLVIAPAIVRERLREGVPATAPQVHVRHILVGTKAEAEKVLRDLRAGQRFEVIARERSEDTGNKNQGGDLGWATRGAFVKPFSDAAFALKTVGQLSPPVETEFGWHIIQLLEPVRQRPLDESQKAQAGQRRVEEFITDREQRLRRQNAIEVAIPATPTPAPSPQPGETPAVTPAPRG